MVVIVSERLGNPVTGLQVRVEGGVQPGRATVVALYGEEYPLPNLLDHLAMPGCTKIKSQWDRCGVYYVNPSNGANGSSLTPAAWR
jgi:hypothetical protein